MNQAKTIKVVVALLAALIVLTISTSSTQTPLAKRVDNTPLASVLPVNVIWANTYGGAADDRAFYAVPTGDGFLVVGSTRSIAANTTVGWALRLNSEGNAVWNKTFLEGFGIEIRCALNLTDGFLLVGNEFFASGAINGYVARIDDLGNLLWRTILSSAETDKLFSGIAVQDGFVVFGLASSSLNGPSSALAVKLDLDGSELWNKTYGQISESALRSSVLSEDGDYVAAGYMDKGDSNYDFYLLKIAPNGNLIWNKTYGGAESRKAYSMTKAPDGYVLVGEVNSPTTSTDAWVIKVDENGNTLWNQTVGGKEADSPAYVTSTEDGGYLVAGFTFSFEVGNRDFWLFRISDQGQVQFSCTQGDAGYQEAYGVIITGSNSYVMVGWTDPIGQPALIGKATYDFYVVKVSVVQSNNGVSSFQFIDYTVTIVAVLTVTSLLMFKLRPKEKKNAQRS